MQILFIRMILISFILSDLLLINVYTIIPKLFDSDSLLTKLGFYLFMQIIMALQIFFSIRKNHTHSADQDGNCIHCGEPVQPMQAKQVKTGE